MFDTVMCLQAMDAFSRTGTMNGPMPRRCLEDVDLSLHHHGRCGACPSSHRSVQHLRSPAGDLQTRLQTRRIFGDSRGKVQREAFLDSVYLVHGGSLRTHDAVARRLSDL